MLAATGSIESRWRQPGAHRQTKPAMFADRAASPLAGKGRTHGTQRLRSLVPDCSEPKLATREKPRFPKPRASAANADIYARDRSQDNLDPGQQNFGLRSLGKIELPVDRNYPVSSSKRDTYGEGGIRTLGSLLSYGALAKLCFRPLSHLTRCVPMLRDESKLSHIDFTGQ